MVINIAKVKAFDAEFLVQEIKSVVEAAGAFYSSYLTDFRLGQRESYIRDSVFE